MFVSNSNLVRAIVALLAFLPATISFADDTPKGLDLLISEAEASVKTANAAEKTAKEEADNLAKATDVVANATTLVADLKGRIAASKDDPPGKAKQEGMLKIADEALLRAAIGQKLAADKVRDASGKAIGACVECLKAASLIGASLSSNTVDENEKAKAVKAMADAKNAAESAEQMAKVAAEAVVNIPASSELPEVHSAYAKEIAAEAAVSDLESKLKDWGFAPGLGVFVMNGAREVKTAVIENGILRAEFEPKQRIGVILECHFLFLGTNELGSDKKLFSSKVVGLTNRQKLLADIQTTGTARRHDFSAGISVCTELGTNGVRSAGIGPMISLRNYHFNTNKEANVVGTPFNLGIYYITEPRVKTLANGMLDGANVPTGTAIRFDEKSRNGYAIVFSASL